MFDILYYGAHGCHIGTDYNVLEVDLPAKLAEFGRVARGGDTIKIVDLEESE